MAAIYQSGLWSQYLSEPMEGSIYQCPCKAIIYEHSARLLWIAIQDDAF